MELSSIIAVALISAMLILFLKEYRPEYAVLTAISAGCVIFGMVLLQVIPTIGELNSLLRQANVNTSYFAVAFKALGICYLTQFASDICRDFGQTSLAGKVDLAGKVMIVAISLPLLSGIIKVALSLVG
ncbi:MAG: SpoIIIAC/SpoIIIAD family protein [Oscillospiraceae bacterium]|nr:SpoIIIAC/SpoIIIAD family protein [Oscillospiraceae bacterium]